MAREMKDSGIEWIGKIPLEWKTIRGKVLFRQRNEKGNNICLQLLSPTQKYGVIPQSLYESLSGLKAVKLDENADYMQLKTIHKGDFCISLRSFQGGFEYTEYEGVVSPAYQVFYAYGEVSNHYYRYLFKDKTFIDKMNSYTLSLRDGKNIAFSDFANTYIPFPPIQEQKKIADYLDTECARIDAVMEQTRASIEEYKKLKQAVITQAVTKGIRPNRPVKDSGVDWIGIVPSDWQIAKLKYFCSIRSGITLGKVYPKETKLVEYPYLRVANVQGSYTDLSDITTMMVTEDEAKKYRLQDGELLMTEGGDRDKLGRGTVWHAEIDPCLHQNHVFALRTDNRLSAEYVSYLSASLVGRDYFDVTANQSVHLASTNSTTIMNFSIPYPMIEEQREIVAYLDSQSWQIDMLVKKKEQILAEMESYKKSLIYEYVTGKKEA